MLGGWGEFVVAFGFFLITHIVPSQPKMKAPLVEGLGRAGYIVTYGAVSIVALGWLIVAAKRAPFVPLLGVATWQVAAPFVLMLPACMLVAFAVGRPNPHSFGGFRNERFNPAYPGIVRLTRHPYLAAIGLWSLGHAMANPDLAHVLLFGSFLVMAVVGMAVLDKRKRRLVPAPSLPSPGSNAPAIGPLTATEVTVRAAGAVMFYATLVSMHPLIAGVPIRPYLALFVP